MAKIIPKLNLNKTPSIVDSNSLVFAKNIRLDVDNTIHEDYGVIPLTMKFGKGKINGVETISFNKHDNIIDRILYDMQHEKFVMLSYTSEIAINKTKEKLEKLRLINVSGAYKNSEWNIVGIIPDTNAFYVFIHGVVSYGHNSSTATKKEYSSIICYDEKIKLFYPCDCNWSYSGGTIVGNVVNNLVGDKILNIAEQTNNNKLVPLKCINLTKSNINDDESVYTQTPRVPLLNLNYLGNYEYVIPNGVYQFFVRYKLYENNYTNWFPVSRECFAGNKNSTNTNFGGLSYVNINKDSDYSFIFKVEKLNIPGVQDYSKNFESFQIGFILTHDDAQYARAWKHFSLNQETIKFDYNSKDAEEVDISDMISPIYQIYNVGNLTSFKNKLYISNYIETNFNKSNLQEYADKIKIDIAYKKAENGYGDYSILTQDIGDKELIYAFVNNANNSISITGNNGIVNNLLFEQNVITHESCNTALRKAFNNGVFDTYFYANKYQLNIEFRGELLDSAKSRATSNCIMGYNNAKEEVAFESDDVIKMSVNDVVFDVSNTDPNNSEINVDDLLNNIYNYIRNTVVYIDSFGNFVNSEGLTCNTFKISFTRKCQYSLTPYSNSDFNILDTGVGNIGNITGDGNNGGSGANNGIDTGSGNSGSNSGSGPTTITESKLYTQNFTITISTDQKLLNTAQAKNLNKYTTLIPYQQYKFYIHYVTENGEITNGYYCRNANVNNNGVISVPYAENCNQLIYPNFKRIEIPDGYVACFFSIVHSAYNVSTLYDIENNENFRCIEASCLELNTRLTSNSNTLICKQRKEGQEKTCAGHYFYSSDTSTVRYFGGNGVVRIQNSIEENDNLNADKKIYIVSDYEIPQDDKEIELIKCTPFISDSNMSTESVVSNESEEPTIIKYYDDYTNLNLRGYICTISPLSRDRTLEYYSDGSNVYRKSDFNNPGASTETFNLKEVGYYQDSNPKISDFLFPTPHFVNIYSNYNFNYISLSDEPKPSIKTRYYANSTEDSIADNQKTQMWLQLIPSLVMSDIYELKSMYHSYPSKTYSAYDKNAITIFDNTIRASILNGDEEQVHIFKFLSDDYYNVATNRGKITNLVAIGDNILVHCQDSMFRFSGSNSLQSAQGEVQQTESDIFKTGVTEVFGSELGFAGLQYKTDSIISEIGYTFLDRDSRIIYLYSGENQMKKLSDKIDKLFKRQNIKSISFANDFYNNRFFISILFKDNNPITLSFSINDEIKDFISLHDFAFTKAFNTKTKCYFIDYIHKDICYVEPNLPCIYHGLNIINDKIYPQKYIVKNNVSGSVGQEFTTIIIHKYESIVDIINNDNYEIIKTLNNIEWCAELVKSNFEIINDDDKITYKMADVFSHPNKNGSCSRLMIYTDTCLSDIFEFGYEYISNIKNLTSSDYYKYPRYNQGKWSFNYFRNIENTNDIYGYLNKYDDGRSGATFRSDNNSLIEGKYFVIRFFFNSSFKLETLSLNYNNKL